ncbi:hypothetical protein ACLE91_15600 [Bacillus subtilis]|uniref:hypothetical protein n=1 Tax=Bacillus subtilis TaxID=1423 RepID=UPI003D302D97
MNEYDFDSTDFTTEERPQYGTVGIPSTGTVPRPPVGGAAGVGGMIPGTQLSISSLLQQHPRPTSPPPQQALNLVQQLKSNPQLLQLVVQQKPRTLQQLTQYMQSGGQTTPYGGSRGSCPVGWEIVIYSTFFGGLGVDLIFNILPPWTPGIVAGFDIFSNFRVITNVVWEICI